MVNTGSSGVSRESGKVCVIAMSTGMKIVGGLRGVVALAGLAALSAPAAADLPLQTAFYPDPTIPNVPGPAFAQFTLNVTASVGGACGFTTGGAPGGTINAGAIDTTAWSGQASFTPQCTAPWRIAVASQNGALANAVAAPTPTFANRATYDVKLHVVTDTSTVEYHCAVENLVSANANCSFEGTASTSNGLFLPRSYQQSGSYLQASAPAYAGTQVLVAGTYQDVLTVTVSPAT